MKALTLWRPWPWAIFDLPVGEAKRVENRGWAPPDYIIGQRVAIHAGKTFDRLGAASIAEELGELVPLEAMHPLGIIGTAIVKGYVHNEAGLIVTDDPRTVDRWFFGPYGWLLTGVVKLPAPIPCPGAQGLWNLPPDIERLVAEA